MDPALGDFMVCTQWIHRIHSEFVVPEGCEKLPVTMHCFRVLFPKNPTVKAISLSVSTLVNSGVYERLTNKKPMEIVYETALVGHDDKLVYIDSLGYGDIKRFDSLAEVYDEIVDVLKQIVE